MSTIRNPNQWGLKRHFIVKWFLKWLKNIWQFSFRPQLLPPLLRIRSKSSTWKISNLIIISKFFLDYHDSIILMIPQTWFSFNKSLRLHDLDECCWYHKFVLVIQYFIAMWTIWNVEWNNLRIYTQSSRDYLKKIFYSKNLFGMW